MARYLVRRLVQAAPLLTISMLQFARFVGAPAGRFKAYALEPTISAEDIALLEYHDGLDQQLARPLEAGATPGCLSGAGLFR